MHFGVQNNDNGPKQDEAGDKRWWKFRMRSDDDQGETDWWFASTAIPLLAATIGPLANVLSIAALVTYWRMTIIDENGEEIPELAGIPFRDPRWCYWLNVASLILGFVGNIFLLFNFTNRIRYIIALPMTILLWYLATAILTALTISMQVYDPPHRPNETYTQGYWYAVIAAVLYFICSMLLMVNMLGYFLGHYPQHFTLTDHQRTLILQTMLFFIWLAGGGAVFSRIQQVKDRIDSQEWSFVDGLYFCDVTILTVGFGDLYPQDDLGRGLVFPYSVGGIIMLGLVISSIHNFVQEFSNDKVVKRHIEKQRQRTLSMTVRNSTEIQHRVHELPPGVMPHISLPTNPRSRSMERKITIKENGHGKPKRHGSGLILRQGARMVSKRRTRKTRLLLLREEKDRFEAMRKIQQSTNQFKRWWALTLSIIAFGILWNVGAVVFWQCEKDAQDMSYFRALYFCYVSLLTIGYGDMSPKTNAGRSFFLVWSLIAVPTMTILVSDMGDTVISAFKRGTFTLGDFTVLPKAGIWRHFLEKYPWLLHWIQRKVGERAAKKRMEEGFQISNPDESGSGTAPNIDTIAVKMEEESAPTSAELARHLARAIRQTADDMKLDPPKKYCYEEWVEFTRLIRFTAKSEQEIEIEEEEEGLIEWDWIGDNSPLVTDLSEPEFVLDRLCESLARFMRRREGQSNGGDDEDNENGIGLFDGEKDVDVVKQE